MACFPLNSLMTGDGERAEEIPGDNAVELKFHKWFDNIKHVRHFLPRQVWQDLREGPANGLEILDISISMWNI